MREGTAILINFIKFKKNCRSTMAEFFLGILICTSIFYCILGLNFINSNIVANKDMLMNLDLGFKKAPFNNYNRDNYNYLDCIVIN